VRLRPGRAGAVGPDAATVLSDARYCGMTAAVDRDHEPSRSFRVPPRWFDEISTLGSGPFRGFS
jgi:hypothetical protein